MHAGLIGAAGLQLGAVSHLLWQAAHATGQTGWGWAAAGIAILMLSAAGWPAAWRAADWRYAGVASMTDGEAVGPEVWVARSGQALAARRARARVEACWSLGDVATILRLSDPSGLAPRLLVVPASRDRALHRALRRKPASRR